MTGDFFTKICNRQDDTGLLSLYNRVFGLKRTLETWRWLYSQDSLIHAVEHNRIIVGCYPMFRRDLTGYPACCVIDVAVDLAYQRRGLLTRLKAASEVEIVKLPGVRMGYGFTNKAHTAIGAKRLNYHIVSTIPLLRKQKKLFGFKGRVKRVAAFEKPVKFNYPRPIAVKKSNQYLNWRYARKPDNFYQIFNIDNSYIVLRPRRDTFFLVDYAGELEKFSWFLRDKKIYTYSLGNQSLFEYLGYKQIGESKDTLVCEMYDSDTAPYNKDRWYIIYGDFEYL